MGSVLRSERSGIGSLLWLLSISDSGVGVAGVGGAPSSPLALFYIVRLQGKYERDEGMEGDHMVATVNASHIACQE